MTSLSSGANFSKRPTVPVSVKAGDRGGEIVVVDDCFRKIASGIGFLDLQLEAGLYKARFKAGNRSEDHLFEVASSMVFVQGKALEFASPIPLEGTSTNHEYHFYPSREIARGAPLAVVGVGAELFIFVRDSQQVYGAPASTPPPWASMTLRKSDGTNVFQFDRQSTIDLGSGYAAAKISLEPGQYFLESGHPAFLNRIVAFPIVTCVGWSTHVYVDSHDTYISQSGTKEKRWETNRTPDLGGAAVVMVRMVGAPDPDEDMVRLTETARQALIRGKGAISDIDLEEMVAGKSEFPMLGLYAVHALMSRSDTNWQRVGLILQHLQFWLVSEHPDVSTLLLACALKGTALPPLSRKIWPPTLSATWAVADSARIPAPSGEHKNSLLRQYLSGGSIWNSLLFQTDFTRPYADNGDLMPGHISALPPSISTETHLRHLDAARGGTEDSTPSLPNWRQLAAGLLRPNLRHTPFQQAVRRLLLDSAATDAARDTDFLKALRSLIDQFHMPLDMARDMLKQLETEASASFYTRPSTSTFKECDEWARSWTIVHSDVDITGILPTGTKFMLKKLNGSSRTTAYQLAYETQIPFRDSFAETLLLPVGADKPSLSAITADYPLPLYSKHSANRYLKLAENIDAYLMQNPATLRLEGVVRVPIDFPEPQTGTVSAPKMEPTMINTPIHFHQFPDAVEGGRSLLVARAPLLPNQPVNGGGLALGVD